jgi:hypothetical protein
MKDFLIQMLSNSSTQRVSSTRFAYFSIIILVIVLVLSCCFVMIFDVLKPERTMFDFFTGIAEVILAAAALVLCAGVPKALSDKFQNNKNKEE